MRVKVAEHAGYCYGVERALKLTLEALNRLPKPICTLGPLIHNPQVVDSLEEKGVRAVSTLDEIDAGTVIVRTHGVDSRVIEEAKERGLRVVDATCPFVKKAQRCAAQLVAEGYHLVVVGERDHPEVIGILAHSGEGALVVERVEDLSNLEDVQRAGVVVQTTQSEENLKKIVSELLSVVGEVKIFNTVCDATANRQKAAVQLAREVDVMLVVGGKNSANTTRLAQLCRQINPRTHHVETPSEIDPQWFFKDAFVGVTAGASTPDWILKKVAAKLATLS
ncbi:MAG TPA: 4-hydroxy-3-methylbut-2-enyl diphosphate reductase [Actinobacteria bacterium]|nr:4-hydroxy-3-methylbut-2-enyl diphosphate reductase [Actinomycetota bacterium]